jgi:hypothetical protein
MSNKTPFEIRLELLNMAKEMLTNDYLGKREQISNNWYQKVETARNTPGEVVPDHPEYPEFPNESEIIKKAQILNDFVSNSVG